MTQKELNTVTAKKVAGSAFWNGNIFARYFADDYTMDIPTAPPGMPNHYTTWEAERCFEWLNRSVRSWNCEVKEFYSTPNNADLFWAVGQAEGEVFWGEHDGHLSTEYYLKIEFKHGKVAYMSWWMDASSMLEAAGKGRLDTNFLYVPETKDTLPEDINMGFAIDLDIPEIDEYLAEHTYGYQAKDAQKMEDLDMSPEAIRERTRINLQQYVCGVEREKYRALETCSPNYHNGAVFSGSDSHALPDGLPEERMEYLSKRWWAWGKVCSP